MTRRPRTRARTLSSAVVAVVVGTSPLATGAAAAIGTSNPVISSVAPDPSVTRGADGAFHVYATSDDWGDGGGRRLIPHFRSFDLVEWEYVGDAFSAQPEWDLAGSELWAPDVHVSGPDGAGAAVMYYTTGGSAPCIGRATAPGIEGPWAHDDAPVVCYGEYEGVTLDPMDPEVVFTPAGPVMLMGNFEGIHAVPMNEAGTALDGDPVLLAGTGVEAPAVVERDGYTHLFTSAGLCCNGEASQYRVLGGRAETLLGDYRTRTGGDLMGNAAGDLILKGDARWIGPGHVDVVTDDAQQDWMVYHAAPQGSAVLPNGVQRRYMMLDRLDWVTVQGAEGTWPVVGDGTPASTRPADPVVDLPVRVTATGDVTVRPEDDDSGVRDSRDAREVLDLSVRVDSTEQAYSGVLTASLTGPGKQRKSLPILVAVGQEGAEVEERAALPVSVTAGGSLQQSLVLRPADALAPGRYELVIAIGPGGGAGAQELAVFGLEVAADGSLSLGSGALGSSGFGS